MFGAVRGEVLRRRRGGESYRTEPFSRERTRLVGGLTCGESPLPTGFMWLPDAEGLMKVSE